MSTVRIAGGLRLLRENAGLTQRQVAEELDITEASYSRWEAGQVSIRVADLETLRNMVGVDWGTFFEAIGMPVARDYQAVKEWVAERQVERLNGLERAEQDAQAETEGNTSRPFGKTPREPRIADAADRRAQRESGRFPQHQRAEAYA